MSPVNGMGREAAARRDGRRLRLLPACDERGFSLMEVIIATVIAVIAVLGLAHSFAAGRGLIDRYATARDALGAAQRRIETLSLLPASATDLALGPHGPNALQLNDNPSGSESWTVDWVDDPVDGSGGGDSNPDDYKRVTIRIGWTQGGAPDTVRLSRLFLVP